MGIGENGERPAGGADGRKAGDMKDTHDRLRDVIAELKSNRERLRTRAEVPAAAPASGAETPEQARHRLEVELEDAHEALELRRAEEERLRSRLEEIEREHRRICDEYVAAEEQRSGLASLFVALSRLHGTLDRREILAAIQELVVNVLGSEQLAFFEVGPEGRLRAVHSLGVDGSRLGEVAAGDGTIGRAAMGHAFVAGGQTRSEDPDLTACIPIKVGSRVTGALAIWRLLGHKPFLTDTDLELIEVLSTHAGTALYAAGLHERHGGGAA
jgi:hypothetical protein